MKSKGQATGSELVGVFGISDRAIRKQLSKLSELGRIYKIGRPPKVYYLIVKVRTAVAVPQKTLSKLTDRIENAKNTVMVEENSNFKNILLIDDAVGSGTTLNEMADWFVANASHDKEIDILSPLAMASESSHDKEEFLPILKHEFTHLFVHKLAKGSAIPMWFNEGLASYVANQLIKNVKI